MTLYPVCDSPCPECIPPLDLSGIIALQKKGLDSPRPEGELFLFGQKESEDQSGHDRLFQSTVNQIVRAKKGQNDLAEIGRLLGQYIAMRDYPVIVSRAQTSFLGSKPTKPVQNPLDRPFVFRRDSREVEYLKFEMTDLYEHRGKIQTLASEDIQKIGCMFVFYQLLRNAGQQAYHQFHDHMIITIYDIMYQRARKSGFCQITILA